MEQMEEASSQEEGEPPNGEVEPMPAKRARRVNVKYRRVANCARRLKRVLTGPLV